MKIKNLHIAQLIDQTNVGPITTKKDIKKLCKEAKKYDFFSVCVTPTRVKLAKKFLAGSKIKIACVVGFPHGTTTGRIKAAAAREAIKNGANEIDMVLNVGVLKDKDYQIVLRDIKAVVQAAQRKPVKVILETGYLTKKEIKKACQIAKKAGASFVKTSTGYGPGKAEVADIKLMRRTVGSEMGVKASGGIRDYQTALKMIKAGASRLGASAGVSIVRGKKTKKKISY